MKYITLSLLLITVGLFGASCRTEIVDECNNDGQCADETECTLDLCVGGECINRAADDMCPDGHTCVAGTGCVEMCETDEHCDDAIDCTLDLCIDGVCIRRPRDELCTGGQTCDLLTGCGGESGCTTDEECDDMIECTLDICGVDGCQHDPIDERCDDGLVCDPLSGCASAGCTTDAGCNDGIDCTHDTCNSDGTCSHITDHSLCGEEEFCIAGVGCAAQCEADEECQDGDFCNGAETCEPEFGCVAAEGPRDCNDNEECTIDSCDAESDQCAYTINTEIEGCNTFDPTRDYNGCFDIVPEVSQRCAFGAVNYRFSQVCFELVGPVMTLSAGGMELAQSPAPADANFDVEHEITGGCNELYHLNGVFTDPDHFSGNWTSRFSGAGCGMSGCVNLVVNITGERVSGP